MNGAFSLNPYRGIKAGDMVKFRKWNHDGTSRIYSRKVNAMLIFDDHVCVNFGSFGEVVNNENYINHYPSRKVAS